jgi:hypothetical protein
VRRSIAHTALGFGITACLIGTTPQEGRAQEGVAARGTPDIEVLSHVPLGPPMTVADLEIEQELSRPYAYVARMFEAGFDVIELADPRRPKVIYEWRIENADLHRGIGALDAKSFKHAGRYYFVQSVQFFPGGPDADLGAVVFDVTDLPDASRVSEVGRIRYPEYPGGFHNIFMYKHSDGRPLLFTTTNGPFTNVYDMERLLEGDEGNVLVAQIPVPEGPVVNEVGISGYHDFYVGFDPATGQDKFYGGGAGGYYVYDITSLDDMTLVASVTGVPGVTWGHTVTPTPDGRYIVGETEYQYAPLRIFDLKPALDGEVATVRLPISAWTANWQNLSHNHEVRWPYVFVSAYEDGLQIFNMRDPKNPHTVAYYDTYDGPHAVGMCSDRVCNGAFGVDVRNADGLIVISDMSTGFWAFRWKGFHGWDGRDWGMPNISSVQDWDDGPDRVAAPAVFMDVE